MNLLKLDANCYVNLDQVVEFHLDPPRVDDGIEASKSAVLLTYPTEQRWYYGAQADTLKEYLAAVWDTDHVYATVLPAPAVCRVGDETSVS